MKDIRKTALRSFAVGITASIALGLAACSTGTSVSSDSITVWTRTDGEAYTKLLASKYEQSTGVKVTVTAIPNSEVQQKLGSAISSGDVPDAVAIDVVKAPYFMSVGAFEDLTDRVAGLAYAKDLLKAHVEAATFENKQYAVPFTADSSVLFYNKDLFAKAGLDPDSPPKTWADFADAANKISALGNGVTGYHYSAGCGGCSAFALEPMLWASGGDFIEQDNGVLNPKATFDSPEVKDLVKLLNGMVKAGGITTASQTDGGENYGGAFEGGKLGMVASGSFYMSQLQKTPPAFKVGVAPLPGKEAGKFASFAGGDVLAIPAGARHSDQAWEFLKWATGDEAQKALSDQGYTPTRTDLYATDYNSKGPEYSALSKATLNGRVPYTLSFNPLFSDANGPLVSLMQSGVFGNDVEAAAASAQKAAARTVADAPQR